MGTAGIGTVGNSLPAGQLALKVDKTTTVNGHALSGNVTVTASDLGAEVTANKGAANGYAGLGADNYVVPAQLGPGSQLAGSRVAPASAIAAGTQSAAHFSAVAALGTMSTQAANAVAITGGTATGLTQLATTAACTALLGGAASSAQSSLAILASKTIAVPAAISVWRGLDFQTSTLTLTAGGVAPSSLSAAYFAAPVITSPAAYVVPAAATVTIEGPPTSAGAVTITNPAALVVASGKVGIGTNAPLYSLHVNQGALAEPTAVFTSTNATWGTQFVLDSSGAGGSDFRFVSTGSSNPIGGSKCGIYSLTGTAYCLLVDTQANVGIGVAAMSAASRFTVGATKTIASEAGAVYDGVKFAASTVSITGNTQITTATGFNFHAIQASTINCDTAGLTIDHSATLFVSGAPVAGINTPTLSDNLAVWIAAGNVKIGALAGTGSRAVVADANGVLSAP